MCQAYDRPGIAPGLFVFLVKGPDVDTTQSILTPQQEQRIRQIAQDAIAAWNTARSCGAYLIVFDENREMHFMADPDPLNPDSYRGAALLHHALPPSMNQIEVCDHTADNPPQASARYSDQEAEPDGVPTAEPRADTEHIDHPRDQGVADEANV